MSGNGTVTVSIPSNAAVDAASNGNTACGEVTVNFTPDTHYHVGTVNDNNTDVTGSVADNAYTISSVDADHTVVVTYAIDTFSITFNAITSPGLPSDVAGTTEVLTVKFDNGTPISVTKADLSTPFSNVSYGTMVDYSYDSPLASTNDGTQYRWDSIDSATGSASGQDKVSGSFELRETSTVTSKYVKQYELTLDSDPADTGTQTGACWWDEGATPTISTDEYLPNETGVNGVRQHFNGWTTDDMNELTNPSSATTATVNMDKAKTVTANYQLQYHLTVNTNPAEVLTLNPSAVSGGGWRASNP